MDALVVVTGHSRGIGRAVVDATPWSDAVVLGFSRRGGEDEQLPSGAVLHPVAADLSTFDGCAMVADGVAAALAHSRPDRVVLVHAAATLLPITFARDADPETYAAAVRLNSLAPQLVGQAFLRTAARVAPDAARTVLHLTTGAGSVYPGWSAYKAGKAAVDAWVRQVGAEEAIRGDGAVVLAVAPGVVDTEMQRRIRESDARDFPEREKFAALHEQGELRQPGAVARELWELVLDPPPTGTVLDLRDR